MAPWGRSARLAAALLIGMLVPAHADDCPSAKTQAELNQCAGHALGRANAALDATYSTVRDRLDDDDAETQLVAAQKAWLAFRDAECGFETALSSGGSIHPMAVLQCETGLTEARTQSLHRLLGCSEYDPACPIRPR